MMSNELKRHVRRVCVGISSHIKQEQLLDKAHLKKGYRFYSGCNVLSGCRNPKLLLSHLHASLGSSHQRCYSTDNDDTVGSLPKLTDLPAQLSSGFLTLRPFKNVFVTYFTVIPQLDNNFRVRSFLEITEKIAEILSQRLAESDFDGMEDMVTNNVFQQVKRNLPLFSDSQRQELFVYAKDIMMSAVTEVNVFSRDNNQNEKHLEVTTVYHVVKGYQSVYERISSIERPEDVKSAMDNIKILLINLRFIRTFNTETNVASDYVINGLNYYLRPMKGFLF